MELKFTTLASFNSARTALAGTSFISYIDEKVIKFFTYELYENAIASIEVFLTNDLYASVRTDNIQLAPIIY